MRPSMTLAYVGLLTSSALACGGEEPAPAAPAPPPPGTAEVSAAPQPAAPAAEPPREEAHKLLVLGASCWLGGFWGDALGEQDQAKVTGIEARCHELERRIWGATDKTHYEQLRALEQDAVADFVARVDDVAKADAVDGPRRQPLVRLAQALADAVKETTLARRAADRVKRDLDREPDKLSKDEVDAVGPLRAHDKIESLLTLDA